MIKIDKQGRADLEWLFDLALKGTGMSGFTAITKIMDSVEDIKPEIKEEKEKK